MKNFLLKPFRNLAQTPGLGGICPVLLALGGPALPLKPPGSGPYGVFCFILSRNDHLGPLASTQLIRSIFQGVKSDILRHFTRHAFCSVTVSSTSKKKAKAFQWCVGKSEVHRVRLNEQQTMMCVCLQRKALMVWTGQWKNIFRKAGFTWGKVVNVFRREGGAGHRARCSMLIEVEGVQRRTDSQIKKLSKGLDRMKIRKNCGGKVRDCHAVRIYRIYTPPSLFWQVSLIPCLR